jgi:hypothetical protein
MNQKTHTPCTIRWRRLPSHASTQGWVGIPYDKDGKPDSQTRYRIYPIDRHGVSLWGQFSEMEIMPDDPWQFDVDGEPVPDLEVCKVRCLLNWLETLDDLA